MIEFTEQSFIEFANQNKIPMILTPPDDTKPFDYKFYIMCFEKDCGIINDWLYYCAPVQYLFTFEIVSDYIEYNQTALLEHNDKTRNY